MKVVVNIETGRSKGFGFVKFEDARDAEDAIKEADGKVGLLSE
jgi:RNA recognition motif-containing protein